MPLPDKFRGRFFFEKGIDGAYWRLYTGINQKMEAITMADMLTALVTGADRRLGLSVTKGLLRKGWRVFAGRILADYTLLEDLI